MFYLSFGIVGDYFTFFIKILHMYNIILSVGWVILQLLIYMC